MSRDLGGDNENHHYMGVGREPAGTSEHTIAAKSQEMGSVPDVTDLPRRGPNSWPCQGPWLLLRCAPRS